MLAVLAAHALACAGSRSRLHPGWVRTEMGGAGADVAPQGFGRRPAAPGRCGRYDARCSCATGAGKRCRGETTPPQPSLPMRCSTSSCSGRKSRPIPATSSACARTPARRCTWCAARFLARGPPTQARRTRLPRYATLRVHDDLAAAFADIARATTSPARVRAVHARRGAFRRRVSARERRVPVRLRNRGPAAGRVRRDSRRAPPAPADAPAARSLNLSNRSR